MAMSAPVAAAAVAVMRMLSGAPRQLTPQYCSQQGQDQQHV
jgi:hypothetical protein